VVARQKENIGCCVWTAGADVYQSRIHTLTTTKERKKFLGCPLKTYYRFCFVILI
jgi:hypothetical protein